MSNRSYYVGMSTLATVAAAAGWGVAGTLATAAAVAAAGLAVVMLACAIFCAD